MKKRPSDPLPSLVTSFFRDHLQRIRGASSHTVRAYRDGMRLYFIHLAGLRKRSVADLRLEDLDVESLEKFLDYLETERHNGAATRNCRLAALRVFFRHLHRNDPQIAEQCSRVLSVPFKKAPIRPAIYMEPEQARAILAMPDLRTPAGVRDHALLAVLYNTGARVSEALSIRLEDLALTRPCTVRIRGKGGRERLSPLGRDTAAAIRRLVDVRPPPPDAPLFRNARGSPLSRDGAAFLVRKYAMQAAAHHPALKRIRVTPHVLRHSCAVALLQAGVDLTVIRDYLGHASIESTNRYVTTSLRMRREALTAFWRRAGLGRTRETAWKPAPDVLRFLDSL